MEHFTVDEFVRANCEYPGQWDGIVERIEQIEDDKIISMDEYWGDDGMAPQWRLDKQIGAPIY